MNTGFLIDTNVPSELTKPSPDEQIRIWINNHNDLHLSVISIGEIHKGLHLLPQGRRRLQLEEWLDRFLMPLFATRILPVTQPIAERWGALSAERRLMGTPLNAADGLIAATALEHNLTLVTRNAKDFLDLGVTILNPWETA